MNITLQNEDFSRPMTGGVNRHPPIDMDDRAEKKCKNAWFNAISSL